MSERLPDVSQLKIETENRVEMRVCERWLVAVLTSYKGCRPLGGDNISHNRQCSDKERTDKKRHLNIQEQRELRIFGTWQIEVARSRNERACVSEHRY